MVKLAVQTNLLPGRTLTEKMERALDLGFDGVELYEWPGTLIALAEEALRAQISPTAICGGYRGSFVDPDPAEIAACKEDVKRLLDLGAELDSPLIVIPIYGRSANLPAHCRTGRTRDEDHALWLDGLREVTEHADGVGAKLLVKSPNRFENSVSVTLADAADAARLMASPSVKVAADTFHMNIEEADMGASLEAMGDLLGYLHVGDSQRLEPGLGHIDWGHVFRALARMGYDGWVGLECHLSGPPEEVLPITARFLRGQIGQVREAVAGARGAGVPTGTNDELQVAGAPAQGAGLDGTENTKGHPI